MITLPNYQLKSCQLVILIFSILFFSCAKDGSKNNENTTIENEYVIKYLEILELAYQRYSKINSPEDYKQLSYESVLPQEEINKLKYASKNYQLTEVEKNKLKEDFLKMLKVAMDKTLNEYLQ